MLPVCNFLLVLLNGCNMTSFLPQVTNNNNGTFEIQSAGCNCSCQNFPNILKLCGMSNATIPPCATTISDVTETTSDESRLLTSTTPRFPTVSTVDDEVFNDEGNKKKTTTKTPTTFEPIELTTTPYPLSSTIKTTSILVTDNRTSSSPDSSDQRKEKSTTQSTDDNTRVYTSPSSPVDSTTSKLISKSNNQSPITERTTVTEKNSTFNPITSISNKPSTENPSTPRTFDDTITSREKPTSKNVSPSDQSSPSPSISTIQPLTSSHKNPKSTVSGSSTPQYEDSEVLEKKALNEDNSNDISTTENPSTDAVHSPTTNKKSTTIVNYISSTKKPDEEEGELGDQLFNKAETTFNTPSLDDQTSSSPSDSTRLTTRSGKKEKSRTTMVGYSTTIAPTSPTTQYYQTFSDSSGDVNTVNTDNAKITTTEPSTSNDMTPTSSNKFTLLPTMSTIDNEVFNDEGNKKKTTTNIPTTFESIEITTTPYPLSRMTTKQIDESTDAITTTWSTTEVVSTTEPSNETDCDLTDQPQDNSINPLNETELASLRRIKRSLFNYGSELSKVLLKNNTSNIVFSPINFALLLAMARSGCRSPMKEEFDKILRLSPNMTEGRLKLFKSIVDSVNNISNIPNVEVYMANKMYLPQDVNINPKFEELTQIIFQSEPQTIDFKDVSPTVTQLNNWSANRTNERIPIFTDTNHLDSSTSVLLTSVAYFNGNWSKPFDRQFTSKNLFYIDKKIKKFVCTMLQVNKFRYGQLPNLKAEFVELPFDSDTDKALAMIIMLPINGTSLNTVAENLDTLKYTDLKNASIEVVELSLPKFRIESVIDLTENPEEFGLSNITTNSNEFKCLCKKESLQISHIVQKAVIDVHEGGCRPLNYVCPQPEQNCNASSIKFTVNRPFIVLVVNSGMILFSGRVNDPSL